MKEHEVIAERLFSLDENKLNPICHICGQECSIFRIIKAPDSFIEKFKNTKYYMANEEGTNYPIVAICRKCVPAINKGDN